MTRLAERRARPRLLLVSTTWWASDARLAAALRDAGCAVSLLCPRGHPAEALGIDIHRLAAFGRRAALRRAICAVCPDLLVPTDERALRDLHDLHAAGDPDERALVEHSLGPAATFGRLASRRLTMQDAREAGLRVAETIAVDDRAALARWAAERTGPIVLKSDGSSGGEGVRVCDDAVAIDAALAALRRGPGLAILLKRWLLNRDTFVLADRLRRTSPAIVAQRHVPGCAGDLAAFCWRGELLGVAVGRQEQSARRFGPSTMLRLVDHPTLVAGARVLAARLNLSGFIGIDIIIEEATGEPVVIELNPRATPLCGAAPGVAGPACAAARALGSAAWPAAAEAPRELLAYFPAAWAVDPADARLKACHADIPHGDPALLAELLRTPWPQRSVPARMLAGLVDCLEARPPARTDRSAPRAEAGRDCPVAGGTSLGHVTRGRDSCPPGSRPRALPLDQAGAAGPFTIGF